MIKKHWPFIQAHDLAEALCKAAKEGLRKGGEDPSTASGLIFHRVTTAMASDWGTIQQEELAGASGEVGVFVGGPYSVGGVEPPEGVVKLKALRELTLASKRLARGSLREWLRLAKLDPAKAEDHLGRMTQVMRLRDSAGLEAFEGAMAGCRCKADTGWATGSRRRTPLLDLLTWRSIDPDTDLWPKEG